MAALFMMCGVAKATVIYTGVMTIGATDPTQLGRLSRNGEPSDWSTSKAFPGVINTGISYHYTTLDLDLSALESAYSSYGAYLQINFDSTAATTFLSAYLNSYSPFNLATNYLGDAGFSGNSFGNPLFFQVVVPSTNHLMLVLNESTSGGGLNLPGGLVVEAFVDTAFTDLPAPVPEPGTWALLACGMALLVARRAGQQSRSKAAH